MKRKPYELECPTHNLDRFHWNKETGMLAAEASCLQGRLYGRLYNDACDEGFEIHSPKTDRTIKFILTDVETDREGDTLAWHFEPASKLDGVSKVTIFND